MTRCGAAFASPNQNPPRCLRSTETFSIPIPSRQIRIYTIGHSTRMLENFLALLQAQSITLLADIRAVPISRLNPQFDYAALARELPKAKIAYRHLSPLGGFRKPRKDSPNTAWRNAKFRGYADHMQSDEFVQALEELIVLAQTEQVALMCAEANPLQCHRSLVGDALVARGVEVFDILSTKTVKPHQLTPFARVEGTRVTYPEIFERATE